MDAHYVIVGLSIVVVSFWAGVILHAIFMSLWYRWRRWRREFEESEQYYKEHADRKRGRVSLAPQWPADSGGGE